LIVVIEDSNDPTIHKHLSMWLATCIQVKRVFRTGLVDEEALLKSALELVVLSVTACASLQQYEDLVAQAIHKAQRQASSVSELAAAIEVARRASSDGGTAESGGGNGSTSQTNSTTAAAQQALQVGFMQCVCRRAKRVVCCDPGAWSNSRHHAFLLQGNERKAGACCRKSRQQRPHTAWSRYSMYGHSLFNMYAVHTNSQSQAAKQDADQLMTAAMDHTRALEWLRSAVAACLQALAMILDSHSELRLTVKVGGRVMHGVSSQVCLLHRAERSTAQKYRLKNCMMMNCGPKACGRRMCHRLSKTRGNRGAVDE
jgi:hypothetical protein